MGLASCQIWHCWVWIGPDLFKCQDISKSTSKGTQLEIFLHANLNIIVTVFETKIFDNGANSENL